MTGPLVDGPPFDIGEPRREQTAWPRDPEADQGDQQASAEGEPGHDDGERDDRDREAHEEVQGLTTETTEHAGESPRRCGTGESKRWGRGHRSHGFTVRIGISACDPDTWRPSGRNSETNFGDFTISPRIILSESKNVTQLFSLAFRTPTGDVFNGNHVASIGPKYQFWANSWKGLVVRGGAGFEIPYSGDITRSGARSFFEANLAVGYYFTPHDFTPVGDLVGYVSTTIRQPIDNRGTSNNTFLSLTPGFRTHVGNNWYLLGAVEVPVTSPTPYDYQVQAGIMKVY